MPHRRTSQRRTRRLDARWLVTGLDTATSILHHGRTAYLQPVRSGDHPRRYATGQRLALKAYVPGPTEAHLILTAVERVHLGDVNDTIARDLGYGSLDAWQITWVTLNDVDWLERAKDDHSKPLYDAMLARFEQRWAHKHAWLLRFTIDRTAEPRLLAARSDELYVTNEAMALRDEMPALTEEEWKLHIGPQSRYRQWDRLRAQKHEREARTLQQRLAGAQTTARSKGYDIRDETRRLQRLLERGDTERAKQQIALIEQRVYPAAA